MRAGEAEALAALARSRTPGGVLARLPLGAAVPAFAGRHTWVGHPLWTPDYPQRAARANALFSGGLSPPAARMLVRSTGARFLLADCGARADLNSLLGAGLVASSRRFGCATVVQIR